MKSCGVKNSDKRQKVCQQIEFSLKYQERLVVVNIKNEHVHNKSEYARFFFLKNSLKSPKIKVNKSLT